MAETTVGLSEGAHAKLQRLKEDGHFAEMADGYRFAIALALAHGAVAAGVAGKKKTIFNLGTLDPDGSLLAAVVALREPTDEPVNTTVERLAEWGVEELYRRAEGGHLSFSEILSEADALAR